MTLDLTPALHFLGLDLKLVLTDGVLVAAGVIASAAFVAAQSDETLHRHLGGKQRFSPTLRYTPFRMKVAVFAAAVLVGGVFADPVRDTDCQRLLTCAVHPNR